MGDLYSGSPGLSAGTGLWQPPTGLWGGNYGLSGPVSPQSVFGSALIANWDLQTSPIHKDFVGTAAAVGDNVAIAFDNAQWGGQTLAGVLAGQTELRGNGTTGMVGTATAASYNTSTGAGSVSRVDGGNLSYVQFGSLISGGVYALIVTNTGAVDITCRANFGATVVATIPAGSTATVYGPATGGNLRLFPNANASTATFTVTSLKLVPGYHAYQSSAGSQPKLASYPRCGVRNKCENYNANPTDLTGVTKAGDAAATLTVVDDSAELAAAGLSVICTSGKVYKLDNNTGSTTAFAQIAGRCENTSINTASAWVRKPAGGAGATISGSGTGMGGSTSITSASYTRVSITGTPGATNVLLQINAFAGSVVYFILNQLEDGSSATAVQVREGPYKASQAPYAQAYALVADGVDDYMLTPSIDLTAYNKIAVYTAGRKLSDPAATAILLEHGVGGVNPLTWSLSWPRSSTVTGASIQIRDGTNAPETRGPNVAAPITQVLTAFGDYAGATVAAQTSIQTNGSTAGNVTVGAAASTSTKFGNYPLYLFMRAGSSLPFKGAWYGATIAAGITPSAAQTAWAEAQYSNLCRQS